jgi:uncharacterized lipoprotein YmbA
MKTNNSRITAITLSLALMLSLVACSTPAPEHFYSLDYAKPGNTDAAPRYELILDSIKIPESLNRPQFVIQHTTDEADILDDQRWLAPLDEQIGAAVSGNLRAALPTAWIAMENAAHTDLPRYQLKIEVQRLVLNPGKPTELEVSWQIVDSSKKLQSRHRQLFTAPTNSASYAALAASVAEAVRQLSGAIAADVLRLQPG